MSSKTLNNVDDDKTKVLLEGYLRKLKTMKKKYFVLRGREGDVSSGLEYYDNEKKYRAGQQAKRCIELKMCFNINRRTDTKYKHVIALYNKDDVFCIVMDDEKQLEEWLRLLLLLQNGGEDQVDGCQPKPVFEYTWKVRVQDKGLGVSHNMVGQYYVCLSDMKLCLVKVSDTRDFKEFPLSTIRSCGGTESFFYMEVGRQSCTGAGELWMLTDDPNIAKNMSEVIQRAFSRDRDADPYRKRSCSATEMNRPIGSLQRRMTQGSAKIVAPYSGFSWNAAQPAPPTVSVSPPIDVHYHNVAPISHHHGRVSSLTAARPASLRRHSVSAVSCGTSATRVPAATATAAAAAAPVDVTDGPPPSTVISHQRTKSCPVSDTSLPVIVEPHRVLSQSHVSYPYPDGDRRFSGSSYRRTGSAKCTSASRERCDSMPSRNRTTSEGTHKASLVRPMSMRVSYSPPGPCSTDSAGSSLSIDEAEHVATPDENTIFEEDPVHWPADPELEAEMLDRMSLGYDRPPASLSLPIGVGRGRKVSASSTSHGSPCGSSVSDYMVMSPGDSSRVRAHTTSSPSTSDYVPMSPGEPRASTVGSPSSNYMPFSPADSQPRRAGTVTSSPSNQSDYMAMSPAGSNAVTASMDYLPMSPGDRRGKRPVSRDDDDYVPMAPSHSDDGYVDMDPLPAGHPLRHDDHTSDISADSSSATSGTPSDHYLLEKVSAYFTEEEDDARPARHYSFGSQPPRSRVEAVVAGDSARVRAFSMGNQQKPIAHKFSMRPANNNKFHSAPLLSTSWSGNNRVVPQPDPLAERIEMDFTKKGRNIARYRNLPVAEALVTHKNSSADSGYMDMSSKSPPGASPPKTASSKHLFSPPDGKSSLGRKPPHVIASSTLKPIGEKPDIKPQKFPNTTKVPERPYMDMKPRTVSQSSADGYMDMTPVAIKLARKNSSDYMQMQANRKVSDAANDYMPMQPGRKISSGSISSDYMAMSCAKRSSQPIAIVAPSSPTVRETVVSPPQPPNYLPLNPPSPSTSSLSIFSLRRKRKNRKNNERTDSKENIATNSGIFPLSLNSPQSPKKTEDTSVSPEPVSAADPDSLSRVLRTSDQDNTTVDDASTTESVVPGTQARATPPQHRSEESSSISRLTHGSLRGRPSTGGGTCESCRLKKSASESSHPGVSRQVSTSSSSSAEVNSVKEGACGGAAALDKDINYVSLELPAEGSEPRSPRPSPAPSPAPAAEQFIYAEIDFQKSESLRSSAHSFRKIRH